MGISALAFGLLTATFGGLLAGTVFKVSFWTIVVGIAAWQMALSTILFAGAGRSAPAPKQPRCRAHPVAHATVTPLQDVQQTERSGQRSATRSFSSHRTQR